MFEDAVAKKSDYRKFAIRHSAGQDDFAMIAEAVGRRFARMTSVEADDYDRSFATAPNLVVIDGGKGQLGAAVEAMAGFELPRVAVISLAKRVEEVFVPGPLGADPPRPRLGRAAAAAAGARRGPPLRARLPPPAPQRRRSVDSIFDSLPGVGPARRRLLMQRFGTRRRSS